MVVMVLLGVVVCLSIPSLLSRVMRRRRYAPRYLDAGLIGNGDVSILVVLETGSPTGPQTAALAELSPYLRRLGLTQILPQGGSPVDEREAEQTLRRAAIGLAHPELALLFGRPELAIAAHAAAGGYDVVVTAQADSLLSERLAAIGRVHWWGNDEAPVFGPGRLTATPWCPVASEPRVATPTASVGYP